MIQLNLLPDVKATYVSAQRTKRTVITLSIIISAVSIGIVGLLASVAFGAQTLTLNNVQDDIDVAVSEFQSQEDLDKVLTIQNQLISIDPLHEGKPVTSRLFGYLQQTTPADVKIDTLNVNLEENTMEISGNAPDPEAVNKYVDTLKFTEFKVTSTDETTAKAFSDVVLQDFSTDEDETTYTISLAYDPSLFDSQNKALKIIVPKITTTRSQTEAPGELFKKNSQSTEEDN